MPDGLSEAEREAIKKVMFGHDMNQRSWIEHGWQGARACFLPPLKHEAEDAGMLQLEVDAGLERERVLLEALKTLANPKVEEWEESSYVKRMADFARAALTEQPEATDA